MRQLWWSSLFLLLLRPGIEAQSKPALTWEQVKRTI
jgi:hypothetical protein